MNKHISIFDRFFTNKLVHYIRRRYPTLTMVSPDLIIMNEEAFRKSKAIQEQAKAVNSSIKKGLNQR